MKSLPTILLLLVLFFLGPGNAFSQTFNWARQVNGTLASYGSAVDVDAARNSYVIGNFHGAITFPNGCGSFNSYGNSEDIFVAKYDPNGVCLWARQFGSPYADTGLGISVDFLGGSYITGNIGTTATFGSLTVTLTTGNTFVASLNPSGVAQWAVAGGGGFSPGYGIDSRKSVYVTGVVSGPASFASTSGPPCTVTNASGGYDVFVVRYSGTGVCMTAKLAGGLSHDGGHGVSLDGVGNVYVTGTFQGTATFGPIIVNGSTSTPNAFIAKYDPALNIQWVSTITGNAISWGISTDSQGNSYITGQYTAATFSGNMVLNLPAGGGGFVAKLNTTGAFLWARGITSAEGFGISVRETCELYVTGSSFGGTNFGGGVSINSSGMKDIFVARYDVHGGIQWAIAAGGALDNDQGRGISADSFGKASVTGFYRSNPTVFPGATPNLTNTGANPESIFVAKVSP